MPLPTCFASKDIEVFRVALLSNLGAPDVGADNGYVSDAVISIEMTPRVEAGEEFIQKNGSGTICQEDTDCDLLKGNDGVLRLCTNDLVVIGMMTGATVPVDGTGAMGIMWPLLDDPCPQPFALEWWSLAWDGASQAELSGSGLYWHRVIPFARGVYAGHTYERGFLVVTINFKGRQNPNITSNGPFDDWPSPISTAINGAYGGTAPAFMEWRETTIPTAACDAITVTSAAS